MDPRPQGVQDGRVVQLQVADHDDSAGEPHYGVTSLTTVANEAFARLVVGNRRFADWEELELSR